jgi:hypothetical protein
MRCANRHGEAVAELFWIAFSAPVASTIEEMF